MSFRLRPTSPSIADPEKGIYETAESSEDDSGVVHSHRPSNTPSTDKDPEESHAHSLQPSHGQPSTRPKLRRIGTTKPRRLKPPTRKKSTTCDDDYCEEMAPEASVWKTYLNVAQISDLEMVQGWKDNANGLLIFAGSFSVAVTIFVAIAFGLHQGEANSALLQELVTLQQRITPNDVTPTLPPSIFKSKPHDFWIHLLWFSSLALGLVTALGVVLAKQWLQYYTSNPMGTSQSRVRVHQLRLRSLNQWNIPTTIDSLPILLHIAVFLFITGLVLFLLQLSRLIAQVVASVALVAFVAHWGSAFASAVVVGCPHKTPLSAFFPLSQKTRLPSSHHKRLSAFKRGSQGSKAKNPRHGGADDVLDVYALEWLLHTTSNPTERDTVLCSIGGLSSQFPSDLLETLKQGSIGQAFVDRLELLGFSQDRGHSNATKVSRAVAILQSHWSELENSRTFESLMRGLARLVASDVTWTIPSNTGKTLDSKSSSFHDAHHSKQKHSKGHATSPTTCADTLLSQSKIVGSALLELLHQRDQTDVEETPNRIHLWITAALLLQSNKVDPAKYSPALTRLFEEDSDGNAPIYSVTLPPAQWISLFKTLTTHVTVKSADTPSFNTDFLVILQCLSLLPSPLEQTISGGFSPRYFVMDGAAIGERWTKLDEPVSLETGVQHDPSVAYAVIDLVSAYLGVKVGSESDLSGLSTSDHYNHLSLLVYLECLISCRFAESRLFNHKLGVVARGLQDWIVCARLVPGNRWYNSDLQKRVHQEVSSFMQRNVASDTIDWDDDSVEAIVSLCFALFNQPEDQTLQEALCISDSLSPPPYLVRGLAACIQSRQPGSIQLSHPALQKTISTWIKRAEQDQRVLADMCQYIFSIPHMLYPTSDFNLTSMMADPALIHALFGMLDLADSNERQQISWIIFEIPLNMMCDFLLASLCDQTSRMETKNRLEALRKHAGNTKFWNGFVDRVVNNISERLSRDSCEFLDSEDVGWLCEFLDELVKDVA